MNPDLTQSQWRTLQVAPLWVLSAIVGRQSGFEPLELAAFWRALDQVAAGEDGLAGAVLTSLSDDFSELISDYEHEQRSVVTGLWDVTSILSTQDPLVALPFVAALLEVGERLSRARGSFGQLISREDRQTLLLLGALLEIEPSADTFGLDALA